MTGFVVEFNVHHHMSVISGVQCFKFVFRFQSSALNVWQSAEMDWNGVLLTVQAGGPGSNDPFAGKQCALLLILEDQTATNSCF